MVYGVCHIIVIILLFMEKYISVALITREIEKELSSIIACSVSPNFFLSACG